MLTLLLLLATQALGYYEAESELDDFYAGGTLPDARGLKHFPRLWYGIRNYTKHSVDEYSWILWPTAACMSVLLLYAVDDEQPGNFAGARTGSTAPWASCSSHRSSSRCCKPQASTSEPPAQLFLLTARLGQ